MNAIFVLLFNNIWESLKEYEYFPFKTLLDSATVLDICSTHLITVKHCSPKHPDNMNIHQNTTIKVDMIKPFSYRCMRNTHKIAVIKILPLHKLPASLTCVCHSINFLRQSSIVKYLLFKR